ncbi:11454_t:CDS:2 [Acaulospora morrowiae]|uniref:11454_t:CDS:1 n=1 Tax=Acaulospora morrowiae TaxID=94023 RepID=A0A9N8ZBC4_9GLOM|nr:11454_t:CDS:2 [Acaulospora morrowiae]
MQGTAEASTVPPIVLPTFESVKKQTKIPQRTRSKTLPDTSVTRSSDVKISPDTRITPKIQTSTTSDPSRATTKTSRTPKVVVTSMPNRSRNDKVNTNGKRSVDDKCLVVPKKPITAVRRPINVASRKSRPMVTGKGRQPKVNSSPHQRRHTIAAVNTKTNVSCSPPVTEETVTLIPRTQPPTQSSTHSSLLIIAGDTETMEHIENVEGDRKERQAKNANTDHDHNTNKRVKLFTIARANDDCAIREEETSPFDNSITDQTMTAIDEMIIELDDGDIADLKSSYRHHKIFLSLDDDDAENLLFDDKSIISTSTRKFRTKLSAVRTVIDSKPEPIEELFVEDFNFASFLHYSSFLFEQTSSPVDSESSESPSLTSHSQESLCFPRLSTESVDERDIMTDNGRVPLSVLDPWHNNGDDGINQCETFSTSPKRSSSNSFKSSRISRICRSLSMKSGKYDVDCSAALEEYSIPYSSFLTPSPDAKENFPSQNFGLSSLSETDDEGDDDTIYVINSASIASMPKEQDLGRSVNSSDNKHTQKAESSIEADEVPVEKSNRNRRVESGDPVESSTRSFSSPPTPTNQTKDVTSMGINGVSSSRSSISTSESSSSSIRRSWSHIEVRTIKGLFQRKRSSANDVKRRNSYAYQTGSPKTNELIAAESEIRVLNHVVGNPGDRKNKGVGVFRKVGGKKNKKHRSGENNDSNVGELGFPRIPTLPPQLPLDIFEFVSVKEDVLKMMQMRRFTINEIYSTEKSYMMHMRTLKKVFINPFIEASKTPSPLVNSSDIPIIFAHVDDLIRLSAKMVESFEGNASFRENPDSKIGEVFLKHQQEFKVFRRYSENHQKSIMAIKRANENVLCRKFIQRSQRKQETNRLGLSDYMIMPIQRVPRYCLLLNELKKYTPRSHADYEGLCTALANMKSLAKECNDTIQKL